MGVRVSAPQTPAYYPTLGWQVVYVFGASEIETAAANDVNDVSNVEP